MKSLILTSVLTTLFLSSQAVSSFNCLNVLHIETEGVLNYLGNITFSAPQNSTGVWTLEMKTHSPFTFIGGWKVWVTSEADLGMATFRSRSSDLEFVKGDSVTMRFRISWAREAQKPIPVSLIWNGFQLCE